MAKKIRIIPWLDTNQLDQQLKDIDKKEKKIKVGVDNVSDIRNVTQHVNELGQNVNHTNTAFGKLKSVISNTFSAGKMAMTGYLLVLREINQAAKKARKVTEELDKAVTDLQVATEMSRGNVEKLVKSYNMYGKQLASTTTDITSAADDYLRAGKTLNEAEELIQNSIMLSKLGKINSGEATEDLLAVMNGFSMSAKEVGEALDAMVALDMEAATSSGDIATALKYCASSADVAGVSFNKLAAMIGTVQDKTQQSAETVGTFMNTLLSRYRNVKIGQFVDDDGEDISEVETILNSLDIKLRDTSQEFRDFESIIQDVALSWDKYSSVQQAAIAKAFSGTRQQNRFLALMEGYDKVLNLTEIAADSAGTALEKFNDAYMNSLEAKKAQLQNSFEALILNSDINGLYGGILQATTAMVDFINKTNALKGIFAGLTVAGGIKAFLAVKTGINAAYISLNKFQNALSIVRQTQISTDSFDRLLLVSKSLTSSQMGLILSSKNLSIEQKKQIIVNSALSDEEKGLLIQTYGLTTAEMGLTTVTATLGNAFRALWNMLLANPLILVTTAVSAGVMAWQKYTQSIEDARQSAQEAIDTYKETASSIDEYAKKYKELHSALIAAKGNEEETYNIKKQLLELQQELNDKFGDEYGRLNLVTDAYKDQTAAILAYKDAAKDAAYNENITSINRAMDKMSKENNYTLARGITHGSDEGQALLKLIEKYRGKGIQAIEDSANGVFDIKITADPESAYETINEFMSAVNALKSDFGNDNYTLLDVLGVSEASLNDSKEIISKWKDQAYEGWMHEIANSKQLSSIFDEATDAVEAYNQAVLNSEDPFSDKAVQSAYETIVKLKQEMGSSEWDEYRTIVNDLFDGADTRTIAFHNALKNADSEVTQLATSLKGLDRVDLMAMADDANWDLFDALISAADRYELSIEEIIDALVHMGIVQEEIASSGLDADAHFDISSYKEQIDDIQSSISTLRDALESFNSGEMTQEAVLDLMQEFPALVPYVDLAAEGFGNLSEGLSQLITQQPESLINSLESLKESLNTEEERVQVDELINSLQLLSSYGDTGMEAYAATIGATWNDTADVIESVTNQFENLAKVQEAVAGGLTMSATAAAELAKMYPEILTNCTVAANGQITLNEEVVKSILAGDQSVIDAQIAKLEADKAVLIGKKSYAEAQLNIIKQVSEGEGRISKEVAQYRLTIANELLNKLIEAGVQEDLAYAAVAENMAGNMGEYNRIVGEVAEDTSVNMDAAAVSMAESVHINAINSQKSFQNMQSAVWQLADSIKAAANGEKAGGAISPSGGGSSSKGGIKARSITSAFTKAVLDPITPQNLNLDDMQSQLELDIKGYTDAIANIDAQIGILKNLELTFDNVANSKNGGIGGHDYKNKIKDLEKEKDKINNALDDAKSGSGSGSDSGSKKDKEEEIDDYEEMIDFFTRRAKVLQDAFDLLGKHLNDVIGASAKNALIDAQQSLLDERLNNYTDAIDMYQQKANEALSKLPSDLAGKIKDGAVSLTDFIGKGNEDVVNAIKDYEDWADKVSDCKQELAGLKEELRQLELSKFTNIIDDFTDQFDLYGDSIDLLDKQIALFQEAGQLIGKSFYSKQIEQSQKQLNTLEAEKASLMEQLTSAIDSGRIEKGTDEWLEMVNALSDVDGSILDCKKSIEEFDNAINDLHWEVFDRIQNHFSAIDDELGNIVNLLDDMDVATVDNKWTKEGLTQLGLLSQQYELATYQVQQYGNEIDQLNADYMAGRYSATEYADKLIELNKAQWDSVNAVESAKDAIVDLNKARVDIVVDGIEKEIKKYKELIDAETDALDAAKNLHDYQNELADKNKAVTDLERQIAAMQNDTTAASVAKRKSLEEKLVEARKDLEETQYKHSIETQKEALNKQYEEFESARNAEIETLQQTLEDEEQIIYDSMESVKANASVIAEEIDMIAHEHGIIISDTLINSWRSGENAIASYGSVLTGETSAFIGQIMGVENGVYQLQNAANITAASLANTFATRADGLVNELFNSYNSAANVNAMTNALHDSLVNTLERGYDVSSIVNALGSIKSAAESAKAAVDALNSIQSTPVSSSPVTPVETPASGTSSPTSTGSRSYSKGTNTVQKVYKDETKAKHIKQPSNKKLPNTTTKIVRQNSGEIREVFQKEEDGKWHKYAYAKGTRNAKAGLRIINEEGDELTLPKLSSGNYAIGNAGDQILTKNETDNLFDWSKIDREQFLKDIMENPIIPASVLNMDSIMKTPEIVQNNTNKSVNLNYGSLVKLDNCNINDTHQFLQDMEHVAQKAINKTFDKFNREMRYG